MANTYDPAVISFDTLRVCDKQRHDIYTYIAL